MKIIEIEVEDESLELFLCLVSLLKDGIFKSIKINGVDVKDYSQTFVQKSKDIKLLDKN